jgi:hypothetical protein
VQLKFIVKQNLTDQYIQNWLNQIENSSRGEFYGIFKNEFNLIGVLPSSPYVIKFGVVVLTPKIFLQN